MQAKSIKSPFLEGVYSLESLGLNMAYTETADAGTCASVNVILLFGEEMLGTLLSVYEIKNKGNRLEW